MNTLCESLRPPKAAPRLVRWLLLPGEAARLPVGRPIVIRAGRGWVTHRGEDRLLTAGDAWTVPRGGGPAVISALDRRELVVEIGGIVWRS